MEAMDWWRRTVRIRSLPSVVCGVMNWITILSVLLSTQLMVASASGFFELEIVDLQNPSGRLANGQSCRSSGSSQQCSTYFRLCLKEYQSNVTVSSPCTYGNTSSPVLAGSSFTFMEPDKSNARLVLPFTFRWTRSFTLILEAMDYNNSTGGVAPQHREIERAVYSGILVPSADWHSLTYESQSSGLKLTYRVRVQCDPNYYNATCMKLCRPRDDKFGHYVCDENGDKACLPGWTGANCETAICKTGCHAINGRCDQPGECRCRPGWKGEFCDQCMPYPGCKHGYCNGAPWQCICETNWGGILCDQDLNYCGTHEPCLNGGTCENPAPDEYLCKCADGFSGTNCQVVDNVCATAPCLHGGNCSVLEGLEGSSFNCSCPAGWTGSTCQIDVNECESSPCLNGATCIDLENGYRCLCAQGWEGDTCHQDVDECTIPEMCRNALSCQNSPGSFQCTCVPGFQGRHCQVNVNDCQGHGCLNGATCIDLIGEYHCACPAGFTGDRCQTNVDECLSGPCANGGECVDLVNGFRCICPIGYTGPRCETDTDLCHPNPCANGSPCFNTVAAGGGPDYQCLCPSGFEGKNCSSYRLSSIQQPGGRMQNSCWLDSSERHQTCVHGRCVPSGGQDGGGESRCLCDPGYAGHLCTENVNDCAENPCANGGTCIDGIDSFHCVCSKGFDGPTCRNNVDDCAGNPCGENGTCVDLVADFQCRCQDGWKGRTCRNNQDSHCSNNPCLNGATCLEDSPVFACRCTPGWKGSVCHLPEHMPCDANPCRNGATCLNTGQSFTCVCRDGFEGQYCQLLEPDQNNKEVVASTSSCHWSGRLYPDKSTWDEGCNKCQCRNGRTACTRVWCGPGNCLEDPGRLCGPSEICLPVQTGCLREPCPAYGQCRPLKPGRLLSVPPSTAACWPNLSGHHRLAPTCARLTIVVDRFRATPGFSVQSLCGHLRKLAAAQSHLWDNSLYYDAQQDRPQLVILCDLKDHTDDVIQVTISMAEKSSDYLSGSRASAAAQVLGDILSAHYKEGSSMAALVEVRVETASPEDDLLSSVSGGSGGSSSSSPHSLESDSYVVAIVCAILAGLVIVAGLLVLLLWRLRKRPDDGMINRSQSSSAALSNPADALMEKAMNNLQNEENLRIQQNRRSMVVMKTLNVSDLPDHHHHHHSHQSVLPGGCNKNKILAMDSCPTQQPIIPEAPSFMYSKAPSTIDVRNNIHLAASKAAIEK